jgi:hypothetical protein
MSIADWITAIGEWAIAGVILYEISQTRTTSFLRDTQADEFYKSRRKIYEAYVAVLPLGASLEDRAEAFRKHLWQQPKLRAACDRQWEYLWRLRYVVRRSARWRKAVIRVTDALRLAKWFPSFPVVGGSLVAAWFPQVPISLWVMLNRYIRERQELRAEADMDYALAAVCESLRRYTKRGKGNMPPLTIWGAKGERIDIPSAILQKMLDDGLDTPFAPALPVNPAGVPSANRDASPSN